LFYDGQVYDAYSFGKAKSMVRVSIFVKDDIYYAIFRYTRDNRHKVYYIKNDNGNAKINLLLEGSVWSDEKLEYLYRDDNKLYFSKYLYYHIFGILMKMFPH